MAKKQQKEKSPYHALIDHFRGVRWELQAAFSAIESQLRLLDTLEQVEITKLRKECEAARHYGKTVSGPVFTTCLRCGLVC